MLTAHHTFPLTPNQNHQSYNLREQRKRKGVDTRSGCMAVLKQNYCHGELSSNFIYLFIYLPHRIEQNISVGKDLQ